MGVRKCQWILVQQVVAIVSTQTTTLSAICPVVAVMAIARLVCDINRLSQIKHLQSLVFAHGFGHKEERLSIPDAGQIDALCI